MECAMVNVSTGTMNCLIAKLQSLGESSTSGRQEITGLTDELRVTVRLLQPLVLMWEDPTVQAKKWMRQVREMVYDIEDWVDDFLHRSRSHSEKEASAIKGLVRKLKEMGSSDEILSRIQHFSARVKAANNRHNRYELGITSSGGGGGGGGGVDTTGSSSSAAASSSVVEVGNLVGMDGPRDQLLDLLGGEGKQVKVISMVGSGGLGKTTLAMQVYGLLQPQFKCGAFVYVGRTPSVRAVLKNIFSQINRIPPDEFDSWDEQQLVIELKKSLQNKKYLVVISDVWSLRVYQVIKGALPESNVGSRIMLTTCSYDLVTSFCILHDNHVFEVQPLRAADSKTLLLGRISTEPEGQCPEHLEEACNIVLERCGGMPLAILIMAGVLARTREVDKEQLESYISSEEYFSAGDMKKILDICYMALPNHLKSCFLYLTVFPKKYVITKGRLIRRWIAEGFISGNGQKSSLEIGESYLNELVNRSLIQPMSSNHNDQDEGYIVHDMIHEFITSLSAEENFVTVQGEWIPHNMIRRLSLQYKNFEFAPTMVSGTVLSHIRSMTIFGYNKGMPDLSLFQYLRVLDLEDADQLKNNHLKNVGKLFQLRYLGLGGKDINKLPEQIADLQHLETLDVRRTNITELPAAVLQLEKLHTLLSNVYLTEEVGRMKEVEELSLINISKGSSSHSVAELGKLKKLRTIGVKWSIEDTDSRITTYRKKLVDALKDLGESNIKSLTIDNMKDNSLDFLADGWPETLKLKKFKLLSFHGYFQKITDNMVNTLSDLTHMEIGIIQVREALMILGGLPALVVLKLRHRVSVKKPPAGDRVSAKEPPAGGSTKETHIINKGARVSFKEPPAGDSPEETCVIINKGKFPCLKEFWYMRLDGKITGLCFQEQAMPKLQSLVLQLTVQGPQSLIDESLLGINHLSHLKHVHFKMDCEGEKMSLSDIEAVEDAIRRAARQLSCSKHAYGKASVVSEIGTEQDAIGRETNIRPIYEFEFSKVLSKQTQTV